MSELIRRAGPDIAQTQITKSDPGRFQSSRSLMAVLVVLEGSLETPRQVNPANIAQK
jgi:hypothetical protein